MTKSQINKIILNSDHTFSNDKLEIIREAFTIAVRSTRNLLQELPNVDIVFYHNPEMVISKVGIGGNTESQNVIMIPLDAKFNFSRDELMLTICHELHHAARMKYLGDTNSLFKKIISEGLADQFELEIDPLHRPITYRDDIPDADLIKGIHDLEKIKETGDYDYYEWFFGSGKYPNWFGYTLGNYIIEKYCAANNLSPSQLISTPAKDFKPFVNNLNQ